MKKKRINETLRKMKDFAKKRMKARDIYVEYTDAGNGVFELEFESIIATTLDDLFYLAYNVAAFPTQISVTPEGYDRIRILYDLNK